MSIPSARSIIDSHTDNWETILSYIVTILPAAIILPLLTAPVPLRYHSAREVAGYYQSLAFLRTGLDSYLFLTPQESYSSLHLHSLLSAPLVNIGYIEGGRLVSLLAAVATVPIVIGLTRQLFHQRIHLSTTPLLAGALLWLHPVFQRFAYAYQPESISIALTGLAMYAALRSTPSDRYWFSLSLLCLTLAIWNHGWEATIGLPLVAVFLLQGSWKRAVATGLTTVSSLAVAFAISNIQSHVGQQGLISIYGLQNNPGVLLTIDWWLPFLPSLNPFYAYLSVLIPVSVIAVVGCISRWQQQNFSAYLIIAAWIISALSIVVLLPFGFMIHGGYYAWGFVLPLSILAAVIIQNIVSAAFQHPEVMTRLVLLSILAPAMLYGAAFELGAVTVPSYESPTTYSTEERAAVAAGQTLNQHGVSSPADIAFRGDWPVQQTEDPLYVGQVPGTSTGSSLMGRTLIYSGVLIRSGPGSPVNQYMENENGTASWCVTRHSNRTITVSSCE